MILASGADLERWDQGVYDSPQTALCVQKLHLAATISMPPAPQPDLPNPGSRR
ncbi:hypothetical protein GCM10009680_87550 [Streptomyces yatensis]|uniref:Uncharacterized protein n=1 Tax=Streptomyces yatensis TaxID=155177 RepID=A0ABP4VSZ7_9ACTN